MLLVSAWWLSGWVSLLNYQRMGTIYYKLLKRRRDVTSWSQCSYYSPYFPRRFLMKDDTAKLPKRIGEMLGWNQCYHQPAEPVIEIQEIEPFGNPLFEPVEICEEMTDEERAEYDDQEEKNQW